jgi:hypothetical protein
VAEDQSEIMQQKVAEAYKATLERVQAYKKEQAGVN